MLPLFFQAVLVIWRKWAQISTANAAAQELYIYNFGTASYKMPSSRIGPKWGVCSAKKWSCEVVGSDQFSQEEADSVLCSGRSGFSHCWFWHFIAQWDVSVKFDARNHAAGKFCPGFGNHPSLVTYTISTVEVVLASCHYCASKLCLQFGPFRPRSRQQMQLPENYSQVWDS